MRMFDGRVGTHENAAAIKAAEEYAAEGGQGLHVWDPGPEGWPGAPACFQKTRPWAHLFDQDHERLVKTARALGVRVIHVERIGGVGQHIDLCGVPLSRAMNKCKLEARDAEAKV